MKQARVNFITPKSPQNSYTLDLNKSKLIWRGYYVLLFNEHHGVIQLKNGSFQVENKELKGGSFAINMKTISSSDLDEENGKNDLDKHLMGEDFFAVETFPTSTFEITRIEKIENLSVGKPNYIITGNLTIKDITHPITFPATASFSQNKLTAKAQFKFDRTKWNIQFKSGKFYQNLGDGVISDGVGIELDLVAYEQPKAK